ncbi:hypothetical protein CP880_08390 [Cutibacterium namnetense]|uniref:Uncharacterized protein n=1 Tax=Cutibacterium namnetense TaxID=1574624 RepID=A0ABX9IB31_9ACTN|nr:hypothetical protein CP880_08390 [Cutibacterium namnetense]
MPHGTDPGPSFYTIPSFQSFFGSFAPTDRYSDPTSQPLSVGLITLESSIDKVVAWRSPTVNLGCTQS